MYVYLNTATGITHLLALIIITIIYQVLQNSYILYHPSINFILGIPCVVCIDYVIITTL